MFGIVIVTHNSEKVIGKCIKCVANQSRTDFRLVIVDSGSTNSEYLDIFEGEKIKVIKTGNVGYAGGNNIGTSELIPLCEFIIFLNPDAFIPSDFLEKAYALLQNGENAKVGILGPKLFWYNLIEDKNTSIIDSAGQPQTWYGRWYDRGWGSKDQGEFESSEYGDRIDALTGALLICRSSVLQKVKISQNEYFDKSFFMYKEDIDLCIRVSKAGFLVKYCSHLIAWHCRGYTRRKDMPKWARILSAKNELKVNIKRGPVKFLFSLLKYPAALLGF